MKILELKIEGVGTRKELSDALKLVATNLFSEDGIEEIYDINGAEYLDNTLSVSLIDKEND